MNSKIQVYLKCCWYNRVVLLSVPTFIISLTLFLFGFGLSEDIQLILYVICLTSGGLYILTYLGFSTYWQYFRTFNHLKRYGENASDLFIDETKGWYCHQVGVRIAVQDVYKVGILEKS